MFINIYMCVFLYVYTYIYTYISNVHRAALRFSFCKGQCRSQDGVVGCRISSDSQPAIHMCAYMCIYKYIYVYIK